MRDYLVVNTVSGEVSIENKLQSVLDLKGYEITSPLASLDVTSNGWRSLQDQNVDPVFGGEGPGETWQEGANPSSQGFRPRLERFIVDMCQLETIKVGFAGGTSGRAATSVASIVTSGKLAGEKCTSQRETMSVQLPPGDKERAIDVLIEAAPGSHAGLGGSVTVE